LTGSLKVTETFEPIATPVAPSSGDLLVIVGASSPQK
jgi:hypothetical protein